MVADTFPLVEVSGTSYEMGYQHGAQAAELIQKYLVFVERLGRRPREVLCRNAMAFAPLMQAVTPAFVEEVRGVADGARISLEEAMLCQCRAEAPHIHEGACTAFALTRSATADGRPMAGQNLDLEPEYADVSILLHLKPTNGRPRVLMHTFAGQIGYMGMNHWGLAHFNNALSEGPWRMGIPHRWSKRIMLEKRTVAECLGVLRQHKTCSTINLVLCDGEGTIADAEVRPEGIAVFEDDHPDWRVHTNHYLAREYAAFEPVPLPNSVARLERMRGLIRESWGAITVDTMKAILADHESEGAGICRHGERGSHSICGYIAEPARGVLHIRRGHGCLGTWQAYTV